MAAETKKRKRTRKRRAECNLKKGLCFHGAFTSKEKAERKAATRPGAFVFWKATKRHGDFRYIVATPADAAPRKPKRKRAVDFNFGFGR